MKNLLLILLLCLVAYLLLDYFRREEPDVSPYTEQIRVLDSAITARNNRIAEMMDEMWLRNKRDSVSNLQKDSLIAASKKPKRTFRTAGAVELDSATLNLLRWMNL